MTDSASTDTAIEIRRSAMDLLARRDHSRRELRDKLRRRYSDETLIEDQIDRLADEKLQSDERFAESFLRQRVGKGYGPLRIRQELKQRGIDEGIISRAFEAEPVEWSELAAGLVQRKYGSGPASDLKEKARRTRFLQYRGFSYEHYSDHLE